MNQSFDLSKVTPLFLDQLRSETDPLADSTVQQIIDSGNEKRIGEVFMTLVTNDSYDEKTFKEFGPDLTTLLNEYFKKSAELPDWIDSKKIKIGEEVFANFGPEIFMLLNVSSLPMCYTCAKGAQVLFETGRLMNRGGKIDPLARRLMETAQMIVNVMAEGGLSANGAGVVTTQKIRLIHASIRHYLKAGQFKNTPWNAEQFGEPINQEDLTGTLMSFGPVILSGLKQLKVDLTEKQIEGYMHCWKAVGHLMGIKPELLPDSYDDGFELAVKILKHQGAKSQAGEALTRSCLDFIQYIIPGNSFDDVPVYLMNYFLQDFSEASNKDLSSFIGVDVKTDLKDKIVLALTKYIVGAFSHLNHHGFVQKIVEPFNKLLMKGIIHHFNDGKQVHFVIPPSLQKNWGLMDEWDDVASSPKLFQHRLSIQKEKDILD